MPKAAYSMLRIIPPLRAWLRSSGSKKVEVSVEEGLFIWVFVFAH